MNYKLIFNISLIFFFFSCNNSINYNKVKKDINDIDCMLDTFKYDSIFAILPNYSIFCNSINNTGIEYSSEILLNPNSAENYFNSKETAFALGMFTADLGYVRHFEQVQQCINYLNAFKILADKLAFQKKQIDDLVPVMERNLNNKDSILIITDSILNCSKNYFTNSEMAGLGALYMSGLWTETLFLGLNSELKKGVNDTIIENHFKILKQINILFSTLSDNSEIDYLKRIFVDLETKTYKNPNLKKDINTIRKKYEKN